MAYHEAVVLEALQQTPRWSVAYWADRGSGSSSGTLLSLRSAGKRHLVVVDDEYVTHMGRQYPRTELPDLLQQVQSLADLEVLNSEDARAAQDRLIYLWRGQPPDGPTGIWPFPRGAYVRWFADDRLHVEAGEGGAYDQPMPDDLAAILVDLGWNPPNDQFRNCWLQPSPDDLAQAAAVAVLTPLAAFGCEKIPGYGDLV